MEAVLAVLVLAGVFWIVLRSTSGRPDKAGSSNTRGSSGSDGNEGTSGWTGDPTRDVRPDDHDYWLEWRESADGDSRGYVVVRTRDDQRLSWRTLPREEGIRAVDVAGESYHSEDLQSPDFDVGSELALVSEPENPHGTTSVAIKSADGSKQVGYIPTDESSPVFKMLENGEEVRAFSIWEVWKQGDRVSLRVLIVEPDANTALPGD